MNALPADEPIPGFAAVIPAGGVGSRLWPLSRPDRPKFLLDLLGGGRTLIQSTFDRLSPLASITMVVTGAQHADAVAGQLPALDPADIVAEPTPRDSMAAIALAAAILERRHGPLVMGSFAADHVIPDAEAFRDAVRIAVRAAQAGEIVTLGIEPTGPSEAFGYIEAGAPLDGGVLRVRAFTEKPDEETARGFLAAGGYFWNAGMFVMRTDVLLAALTELQPTMARGVREIAAAWDEPGRADVLGEVWPTLTRIAIDHAIAEPVAARGGVAVVPAPFEWFDVGDFDSLASLVEPRDDGVRIVGRSAPTVFLDSDGSAVMGGGRPIVVVGVPDVVVVDTEEALLVTSRAAAQRVKEAAAAVESAVESANNVTLS